MKSTTTTESNSPAPGTASPKDFSPGKAARRLAAALAAVLLAALAVSSFVLVDETEYVIVERLGDIVAVYDRPADRGLHVKLPWPLDVVRRFDRRVQLFDPPGREIFTRDKKNITVDTYVCWKIADTEDSGGTNLQDRPVVRFFRGLGSVDVAEQRLDSRVHSILSTEIGHVELSQLLIAADSESGPSENGEGLLATIAEQVRRQVERRRRDGQSAEESSLTDRVGIEIVDVRIKRINLPAGNQQAVFERMKSERKKIADRYRSAGMAENKLIRSRADLQYNEILVRAQADAERIRGEAEAESIGILNRAHAQDPEFHRTLQTLDAYRRILNEKTTLVLSASSNLLKLLTDGVPDLPPKEKEAPVALEQPATAAKGDEP